MDSLVCCMWSRSCSMSFPSKVFSKGKEDSNRRDIRDSRTEMDDKLMLAAGGRDGGSREKGGSKRKKKRE
jgi:hypothetical protein